MAAVDDLYSQIPIGQIASQLGIEPGKAGSLVQRAIPTLIAGMQANAKDPGGASSLTAALGQHDGTGLDQLLGDTGTVDTTDGAKILSHVFGDNRGQITDLLDSLTGVSSNPMMNADRGLMSKVLPMLAPIVMGWLGRMVQSELGGSGGLTGPGGLLESLESSTPNLPGQVSPNLPGAPQNPDALENMLGGLLGGALGGGGAGGTDPASMLAGLLGGDSDDSGGDGGGLAGVLGSLLGAGTK